MNTLLNSLRNLPSIVSLHLPEKPYPFSAIEKGLPKASLIEISGSLGCGKTQTVLKFLSENKNLNTAWIEKDFTIYPSSFPHYQVDLSKILFIHLNSTTSPIQVATQILKSQVFQVVVLSQIDFLETDLRRLQLLAKQWNILVILLHQTPLREKNWSVFLQIQVVRPPSSFNAPSLKILRSKNLFLWPVQNV